MKNISLAIILSLIFTCLKSQTLHCYAFCNTDDPKIGIGAQKDRDSIISLFRRISIAEGKHYEPHTMTGSAFSMAGLLDVLQKAKNQIKKDDIVVLYISSHGARAVGDVDTFPRILFPIADQDTQSVRSDFKDKPLSLVFIKNGEVINGAVSSYDLHRLFIAIQPNFVISLVDACNGQMRVLSPKEKFVRTAKSPQEEVAPSVYNPEAASNIKELFQNCLNIITCAAEPGKECGTTSEGSDFTRGFTVAFTEMVTNKKRLKPGWDAILQQTTKYTIANRSSDIRYSNNPRWDKRLCRSPKSVIDSFAYVSDLKLNNPVHKVSHFIGRTSYRADLFIQTSQDVDSITYFLDPSFEDSIVTFRASELKVPIQSFHYILKFYEAMPVRAKIFFRKGDNEEVYTYINPSDTH